MKNFKKMTAVLAAAAISASSLASVSLSASALEATDTAPFTAWLVLQAGGDMKWNSIKDKGTADYDEDTNTISGTEAEITGDGEYSVDVTMATGSETIECMFLQTNINGYAFIQDGKDPLKDGVKLAITSVTVEHADGSTTEIAYNGPSEGAYAMDNSGVMLRLNLYNTWGNNVKDITNTPEGGLVGGDKLVVNFTVDGMTYDKGDVDGDGSITTNDAYQTLLAYSSLAAGSDSTGLTAPMQTAADVDEDGSITASDALYILTYYSIGAAGGTADWSSIIK